MILIKVPTLNERSEDVPELVNHFLDEISAEYNQAVKEIDKAALDALQKYTWTGNIRELRNVVERLIILGGDQISEKDVKLFASK